MVQDKRYSSLLEIVNAYGDKVLDELAKKNEVAYVRFASVYYEFKTLDDFVKILEQRKDKGQK